MAALRGGHPGLLAPMVVRETLDGRVKPGHGLRKKSNLASGSDCHPGRSEA